MDGNNHTMENYGQSIGENSGEEKGGGGGGGGGGTEG